MLVRNVDHDLWERARVEAMRRKWTMGALIDLALRQLLNGKAEASS